MKNSTIAVFSVLKNIETFVKKNKDVDIFKKLHIVHYKNCPKFYQENCKRFYNDIENGYYTLTELGLYILYQHLMQNEKINLFKIKPQDVIETMKLFTKKRLDEDLKILAMVFKQLKFRSMDDFFDIKEDGTNIVYILTIRNRISPIFYIRNIEKYLTNEKENVIINNEEYCKFERISKKIKHILNGGS